ncbi:MAG: hypothetical protein IPJ43_08740 [Saprospiraceae bacterium]|nr:hypothetical protein [Saprospiraceae bacterium]
MIGKKKIDELKPNVIHHAKSKHLSDENRDYSDFVLCFYYIKTGVPKRLSCGTINCSINLPIALFKKSLKAVFEDD